jgi:hypothetical protein
MLILIIQDNTTKCPSNTTPILYLIGWLNISAFKRQSSGYPLVNKSIKSKPCEMAGQYEIPCGFTKTFMDKNI